MIVLPIVAVAGLVLLVGLFASDPAPVATREIAVAKHGTLIIDGKRTSRSEHGFSQRAGYRAAGSAEIEWFGDVSDGVEPQAYENGSLIVVLDIPAAQIFVRVGAKNWKTFALVFPNDLGPSFPISFYAKTTGLTMDEVSRINELGGKRDQKWPTTYIQNFDPATRDLNCSYHVDNKSSWPLHLRLSEDGSHLALIGIGESAP